MKTFIHKVDEKIAQEFDLIKQAEGMGSGTSTFSFLIKYYWLTKDMALNRSIDNLERNLSQLDVSSLPSARDQLSDI
jgi:hypothetical protein